MGSNPRLASFFCQVAILTKINSLAFDEKRREEEDESCKRGLLSREDAAMIGIQQRNLKREKEYEKGEDGSMNTRT